MASSTLYGIFSTAIPSALVQLHSYNTNNNVNNHNNNIYGPLLPFTDHHNHTSGALDLPQAIVATSSLFFELLAHLILIVLASITLSRFISCCTLCCTLARSVSRSVDEETDEELIYRLQNQFKATSNTYTKLLLWCVIFFSAVRILQGLFIGFAAYTIYFQNTFFDVWFNGDENSEGFLRRAYWFVYILGLMPFFMIFLSVIFQWYVRALHSFVLVVVQSFLH